MSMPGMYNAYPEKILGGRLVNCIYSLAPIDLCDEGYSMYVSEGSQGKYSYYMNTPHFHRKHSPKVKDYSKV